MKRTHKLKALLFMGLLALFSCHDEKLDDSSQPIGVSIGMSALPNGANSRATNDTDPDNQVKQMRVMLFRAHGGELKGQGKIAVSADNRNPSVDLKIVPGTYDVVVVCNEPVALTTTLDGVSERSELDVISADFNSFKDDTAIPMVGESRSNVHESLLVQENGKNRVPLTVKVSRIVTRVKLTIYSKKDVGLLTSISLAGFPEKIGLMEGGSGYAKGAGITFNPNIADFVDETLTMSVAEKAEYQHKQTLKSWIVPSWVFNPSTDKTQGVEVTAEFGPLNMANGKVSHMVNKERRYTLDRNTIYNITVIGSVGITGVVPPEDAEHEEWL